MIRPVRLNWAVGADPHGARWPNPRWGRHALKIGDVLVQDALQMPLVIPARSTDNADLHVAPLAILVDSLS